MLDGDEGVLRYGPAVGCTGKLDLGANSSPRSGNSEFALVCTNMPPRTMGLIAMASRPANVVLPSLLVLVDPVAPLVFFVPTDASGVGLLRAPVAANAALVSRVVHAQAFAPSACGPLGVSASLGLKITVQR